MIIIPDSDREKIIADFMPDLTPLLDVVFMLIIFLILTANPVPYGMEIDLPEDNENISQVIEEPKNISITILAAQNSWKINDKSYNNEKTFKAELLAKHKLDPEISMIIVGEKSVTMQKFLNLIGFLKKHNIDAVDIVMESKQ